MSRTILGALLATGVLAVTASAERAYVTSNEVKIMDDEQGLVGTIDLGKTMVRDMAITANGKTAYLGHSRGIAVVDVATSAVTATWSDRTVTDLVLREDEGTLYSLQHGSGEAYQMVAYDLGTGAESNRYDVDFKAWDMVVAGTGRVFTTNVGRSTVSQFDRSTGAAQGALTLSTGPAEDELGTYIIKSLLSADGGTVYVVLNGEAAGIVSLDATTGEETGRISLGHPAYVRDAVLSPDGTRAYLSALDHLAVIDLVAGTTLAWVDLEVTHQGIDVSPDGSRLYLVNPVYDDSGSLAVVDATSFELIRRISVPDISPYRVAVLP